MVDSEEAKSRFLSYFNPRRGSRFRRKLFLLLWKFKHTGRRIALLAQELEKIEEFEEVFMGEKIPMLFCAFIAFSLLLGAFTLALFFFFPF